MINRLGWRRIGFGVRKWRFLALLLASVAVGIVQYWPFKVPEDVSGYASVIDGDSVRVAGEEVRLVGIDAPESQQTCFRNGKDWSCGRAATRSLQSKLRGAKVDCEVDGVDKYDRLLAVCFKGKLNVNAWMVEQGWAVSYGDFRAEEQRAEAAQRGIWSSEFDRPHVWRNGNMTGAVAAAAS